MDQVIKSENKTGQRLLAIVLAFVGLIVNSMISTFVGIIVAIPFQAILSIRAGKTIWVVTVISAIVISLIVKKISKKYTYFFNPFAYVFLGFTLLFFLINFFAP